MKITSVASPKDGKDYGRAEQESHPLRPITSKHQKTGDFAMQILEIFLQHMVKELQKEAPTIACCRFTSEPLTGRSKRKVMLPGGGDACNASLCNDSLIKCFRRTCAAGPRGGPGRREDQNSPCGSSWSPEGVLNHEESLSCSLPFFCTEARLTKSKAQLETSPLHTGFLLA